MGILSNIGRVFFGVSIAALGVSTIYYHDFPYFLVPPKHSWLNDHVFIIYLCGALLLLAGAAIALGRRTVPVALVLGTVFLLVFLFYFVPYELVSSPNHLHFGDWENSAKELALGAGAFVMAGRRVGFVLYSLTIISFGVDHWLYAHEAVGYMPVWVGHPVTWLYITGTALLGAGLAILLNFRVRLFATLLGAMIFIWVIILHIPYTVASNIAVDGGELVSAFLALACCGIAFAIAGASSSRKA